MRNNCNLKQNRFCRFETGKWIPCSCLLYMVLLAASTTALKAAVPSESMIRLEVQNREITGKISDGNGQPLASVTVSAPDSKVSTASKADGTYTISLPLGAKKLMFNLLGYKSQEVDLSTSNVVNVVLSSSAAELDEVVVVGYGTMRKKDLTGSVTQIHPDRIANENPKTVQDILRGSAGLNIGYDASAKGGGSIEVRGKRSVYDSNSGHNNPLLVLDGMIFYGELSEINPDDIEQIDVLKDASAAAVYGSKAASGVIIISTKKGKQGKPTINMTMNAGATQLSKYRKRFSPEAYLQHREDWYAKNTYGINPTTGLYEAYQTRDDNGNLTVPYGFYFNPGELPSSLSLDTWRSQSTNENGESDRSIWGRRLGLQGNALQNFLDGKTVDWADHTFRTGFNQDYNASISGASDRVNYYLSMGYLKNEGTVVSDTYKAVRTNMKINAHVTNWLELGANVNFQDRSDGNIDIDIDQTLRNSPYADYADAKGNPLQYPLSEQFSQRGYNYDFQKKYLELDKGYSVFNSIFNAKVKLPFNITYSFNASPRLQYFHDRYFMSAELPGSNPADRGANREQTKRFDWSLNNTITWEQTFADKHRLMLTLVQEAEEQQSWKDRIEARNILPSDALGFHNTKNGSKENSSFDSYDTHQTADALLARLFYSYDDRYMLTTSIRRDGYSAFGTSNPYATFPSVALAWNFTKEKFFKWTDVMDYGKLRVSYGKNGNRQLADPNLALANLYSGSGKMHGYLNSAGELVQYRYLMVDRLANPNLQWEKTTAWNFGLDFGFLKNRISGTLEYYLMQTHDMIMEQKLPNFTGFSSITTNLGQVDNKGIELTLNTVNLKKEKLRWSTTFSFSYNKNQIVHLYKNYQDVLDADGNVVGRKEMDEISNGWFIGQPIGAIWNYQVTGIWQANEAAEAAKYGQAPGDPKVANVYTADDVVNGDSRKPVYNNNDKVFLGQTDPRFRWSMRNEFTLWKDLSFSFNIYSYMGHKSLSGNYLNNDDDGGRMAYGLANLPAKEYWTPDNPTDRYGRIEAKGPIGAEGAARLYDRSFIRLDNISVGYTLPTALTSKYNLNRVKLYGTVRNVVTWTKDWEYGDPETFHPDNNPSGWASRVFTFGVNLSL